MLMIDYPSGWYVLLAFGVTLWLVFSFIRKSFSGNILFGIVGLLIAVVSELIGVNLNLWSYTGGNWPAILWPIYFIFAMAFYQIFKVMEKKK